MFVFVIGDGDTMIPDVDDGGWDGCVCGLGVDDEVKRVLQSNVLNGGSAYGKV